MAQVIYVGLLVRKAGTKTENFSAKNVKELLKLIEQKHGKEIYKMAKSSNILVNEKDAGNIDGYKTRLIDTDIVKFLPICGGG